MKKIGRSLKLSTLSWPQNKFDKLTGLIIGCGNIGALYDLNDTEKVWTHAKAFSRTFGADFVVADSNQALANKVAKKYNVSAVELFKGFDFGKYGIVSITTPTPTHFEYLKLLLQQKVPVIICEKPVAAGKKELIELTRLYQKSESKVLVNYIRRFQPAYEKLRKALKKQLNPPGCKGINIKYQRGLLNNGGHAFDLLEFLFDKPFSFEKFRPQHFVFDAFPYDPTVSGSCFFEGCPVTILGVENASYPVFEIELFFPAGKIVICHSGDEVRFYEYRKGKGLVENQKLRQSNILSRYMMPVLSKARRLFDKKEEADNFLQAVELNKKISHVISTIRKKGS
jgi:predicted dehydrogenase